MDTNPDDIDRLTYAAKQELQSIDNTILLAVVRDEIDLKSLAKEILINRGMSLSKGVWVGSSEASAEIKQL